MADPIKEYDGSTPPIGSWWSRPRAEFIPEPIHSREKIDAVVGRIEEEHDARNAARQAIYAAISAWTSSDCQLGDPIPIVRSGVITNWLRDDSVVNALAGKTYTVDLIVDCAFLPGFRELTDEKIALNRLLESLESTLQVMRSLDAAPWLHVIGPPHDRSGQPDVALDVIHSVGLGDALNISIHGIIFNCRQRIHFLDSLLENFPKSRGSKKDIAAHRVAEEYGNLYAKVTGEMPTSSGNRGMFQPALQDLFDALGWQGKDLRGPVDSAKHAVTAEVIQSVELPAINRPAGLFNT